MKISVIIPIKNRAYLLPQTLDNLLAQTRKPYEIIIVDDGSTDHLPQVIEQYKEHVTYTKNKGKYISGARNTGIRMATGDAIQFFDSDDLMTLNKLEVQSRLMEKHQADFVYGPYVKAKFENNHWIQTDVIMQYHPLQKGVVADYVLKGWCSITQAVLFSRSLIEKVGFWNENLMPHEDFEFWFRVGKIARNFIHENESCVIYRQHAQQVTDSDMSIRNRSLDGIKALQFIKEGLDYNPSPETLAYFKGRYTFSKKVYINKYGPSTEIKSDQAPLPYIWFYRLADKLGRLRTGTNWQKMHGVLSPGTNQFQTYMNHL